MLINWKELKDERLIVSKSSHTILIREVSLYLEREFRFQLQFQLQELT